MDLYLIETIYNNILNNYDYINSHLDLSCLTLHNFPLLSQRELRALALTQIIMIKLLL